MRLLSVFLAILVVLVITFLSLAASFGTGRGIDALMQRRRVAELRSREPAPLIADRSIPDSTTLDRVQLLATHNSYHKRAGPLQYFLIGLAQPGEPARLRYEHPALYEQLEAGVRGVELDLRNRGRRLVISHVPMVDNRATCPDFRLALQEIRIWSELNPEHVPIHVLLELKEDWRLLDPRLKPWDSNALALLDALILEEFPLEGLLVPGDVGPGAAWPALSEVRGRVLFILHVDERITPLYRGGVLWRSGAGDSWARVQILNDPIADAVAIQESLARGDLVRTRADADLVRKPLRTRAARESGAQIVSTDYPDSGELSTRVLPARAAD